jgi:alkaline phosphatase D
VTEQHRSTGTSRRAFLAAALATAGAALLDPFELAAARSRARALPVGELFPLGVASGDPTASSVILWTRLISPDPGDPLPAADIAVDWEVATDEAFTDVIASGTAPAVAALAHSVHVDVTGLPADASLFYRFSADGRTTPVGRTRTFPGAGTTPARVRFALASCQNWSAGYYTAYEAMAIEDLDFVVFVGDYIYERSSSSGVRPISLPESVDLPTYRARYELYKGDANLKAAHANFPWIVTMDDHEVANNVLGDNGKDGEDAGDPSAIAAFRARRADAFQAWYEHQPLRLPAPSGADYELYRTVVHSDLARFFVLDGRQYRSLYPDGASAGPDSPARTAEDRTMLGAAQEAWLDDQFAATDARWNLLAQQTVMSATPLSTGDVKVYNLDQWDGYVAARNRLVRSLVANRVRNPLVLTGDIHVAGATTLRLDYDDPASPDVAYELVSTSISSSVNPGIADLFEDAVASLPWVRHLNARERGYCVITLTADEATADFRVVATALEPTSSASTDYTDVIAAREPVELPPTTTTTTPTTTTPPAGPAAPAPAVPVSGDASYTG